MKKIVLTFLISLCFTMSFCVNFVFAEANVVDTGSCGKNVIWTFTDDGTLTISGEGDMESSFLYAIDEEVFIPGFTYNSYKNNIKKIVIEGSVTNIGDFALYDCRNLESVTIQNSILRIGDYAFYNCPNIETVEYTGNDLEWEQINIEEGNTYLTNATITFAYVLPKIIYDANGGYDTPQPQRVGQNSENLLTDSIPYRSGHLFLGWSTDADAKTVEHNPGDTIIVGEEDITLYAVWQIGGYCGENVIWTFIDDGTLTISGEGEMYDYSSYSVPYESYKKQITKVVIKDNITSIGSYAFYNCSSLESVYITNLSLYLNIKFGNVSSCPLYYGAKLYLNDEEIVDLVIPDNVTKIPAYAFLIIKV